MKKSELTNKLIKSIKENMGDILSQLESALKSHDWYYMMSDDHRAYQKGDAEEKNIKELIAKAKSEGKEQEADELFKKYKKSVNENLNERNLTPAELEKRENIMKGLKDKKQLLVKRYGKDAEKVMYGRSTNMVLNQTKKNNLARVTEIIKKVLKISSKTGYNMNEDEIEEINSKEYIENKDSKIKIGDIVQKKFASTTDDYTKMFKVLSIDNTNKAKIENTNTKDISTMYLSDLALARGIKETEEKSTFLPKVGDTETIHGIKYTVKEINPETDEIVWKVDYKKKLKEEKNSELDEMARTSTNLVMGGTTVKITDIKNGKAQQLVNKIVSIVRKSGDSGISRSALASELSTTQPQINSLINKLVEKDWLTNMGRNFEPKSKSITSSKPKETPKPKSNKQSELIKSLETDDFQNRNGDYPRDGKPDTINHYLVGPNNNEDVLNFSFKNTDEGTAKRWVQNYLIGKGLKPKTISSEQTGDYRDDWVEVNAKF